MPILSRHGSSKGMSAALGEFLIHGNLYIIGIISEFLIHGNLYIIGIISECSKCS